MADGGRPGSRVRGLAAATGTGDGAGARGAPATVGVVGCGLLGTSVALRLAEAGLEPLLADADEGAVATAVRLGAGHPWTDGTTAGLAVVAVPPLAAGRVARELLASGRAALATDVASVKRVVQADVEADPSVCTRFCGGHPMAGRERGGGAAGAPRPVRGASVGRHPHAHHVAGGAGRRRVVGHHLRRRAGERRTGRRTTVPWRW